MVIVTWVPGLGSVGNRPPSGRGFVFPWCRGDGFALSTFTTTTAGLKMLGSALPLTEGVPSLGHEAVEGVKWGKCQQDSPMACTSGGSVFNQALGRTNFQ